MNQEQMEYYKLIIDRVANKFHTNSMYTRDDIKQECWVKLLKVQDKIDTFSQDKPPTEVTKYVTAILQRAIIDVGRKSQKYKDKCSSVEFTTNPQILSKKVSHNYDNDLYMKQLKSRILEWVETEADNTATHLFLEMFYPSKEVQDELNKSTAKRLKNIDVIPPLSLCRILDYRPNAWYKSLLSLKQYLYKNYKIESLD